MPAVPYLLIFGSS